MRNYFNVHSHNLHTSNWITAILLLADWRELLAAEPLATVCLNTQLLWIRKDCVHLFVKGGKMMKSYQLPPTTCSNERSSCQILNMFQANNWLLRLHNSVAATSSCVFTRATLLAFTQANALLAFTRTGVLLAFLQRLCCWRLPERLTVLLAFARATDCVAGVYQSDWLLLAFTRATVLLAFARATDCCWRLHERLCCWRLHERLCCWRSFSDR